MSIQEHFDVVDGAPCFEKVWKHKTKPVWVCHFSAIEGKHAGYYQAYRAVCPVPKGRQPWSVDNRRIGHPDHGFPTLEAAMEACQ